VFLDCFEALKEQEVAGKEDSEGLLRYFWPFVNQGIRVGEIELPEKARFSRFLINPEREREREIMNERGPEVGSMNREEEERGRRSTTCLGRER
jgi:hypothetical protein